jgi:homoserine dehydrogenase
MTDPFGIALLGCGTVGGGVAQLLLDRADRLAARAGRPLELRHVVVRDPAKRRDVPIPDALFSTLDAALADPHVQAVAELVRGTGWARRAAIAALAAGKHVVTANKALLSEHGPEVFEAARRHDRAVAFEASVAGGVPIIAALAQSMAANQVVALQGILNGTSNFILSEMTDAGRSYADALAEARRRGYAEADPTLDVDGTDAAHKLAILAQIAFGVTAPGTAIERRGIAGIDGMDIRFAKELGYTIKLVAEGWLSPTPDPSPTRGEGGRAQVALHVAPVLLRHTALLAQVRGAYNAVRVEGDAAGDTLYYGPGAGRMPTASAVTADLIDLATGRAQRTSRALRLWAAGGAGPGLRPAALVRSRFYLRLLVADRPGVLAEVAHALAAQEISIASVIQHEALEDGEGSPVPLVIMTHTAPTDRFRAALAAIDRLPFVTGRGAYYPVAD